MRGYARSMQPQPPDEPIIRLDERVDDDEVEMAAQLVPMFGYEEAERILETSARTHRSVNDVVDAA